MYPKGKPGESYTELDSCDYCDSVIEDANKAKDISCQGVGYRVCSVECMRAAKYLLKECGHANFDNYKLLDTMAWIDREMTRKLKIVEWYTFRKRDFTYEPKNLG